MRLAALHAAVSQATDAAAKRRDLATPSTRDDDFARLLGSILRENEKEEVGGKGGGGGAERFRAGKRARGSGKGDDAAAVAAVAEVRGADTDMREGGADARDEEEEEGEEEEIEEERRRQTSRRRCRKRLALRSRNSFVDACLAEEDGLDSFADLEDFIVCRPGTKYVF